MKLFVKILSEGGQKYYDTKKNYEDDSGFDIVVPYDVTVPGNQISYKVPLGIACIPDVKQGYYLYPRSSITKTPFRLANSVGIIDCSYTGEIIAVVDNKSPLDHPIKAGERLFQLCAPDLTPLTIEFVDELPVTKRGANGFGSTGK
jgi:dUTP pyrophosphatase